jgi:hypothetical protein
MMELMGLTMARLVQQPALLVPLGYPDRVIVVEQMEKASLKDGFTFRCSFFIDCAVAALNQAKSCLLTMKDQKGNHIAFYIQGTSIICRVKSSRGTSLSPLGSSFPSCTWCDVVIILRMRETGGITSLSVNDGSPTSYSTGPLPFADGPLSVTLGGLDEGSESQSEVICQLGPFVLHSGVLDTVHEDRLSQFARRKSDIATSPLFAYPYDCQLPVKLPEKTAKLHFTFVDSMNQKQVVNTLLPLFLDLPIMPKHFPQLLIDLLYCLVLTSVEAKKHAYYFPVISYMLFQSPPEKLTYKLYLKFFGLLENSTDDTLIKALLLHIVFNMELWSAVEAPDLSRIVIHWAHSLSVSCPQLINSCFSFSDLLALIRIYFWFEPVETEIIKGGPDSKRQRPHALGIETCRQHLNDLLFFAGSQVFMEGDAACLLSNVIGCRDTRQSTAFLTVFADLTRGDCWKSVLSDENCVGLYSQFRPNEEQHFVLALEVLHRISDPSFHHHLLSVMLQMNSTFFTADLCSKCLQLMKALPRIYPICCLIAMNCGLSASLELAHMLGEIKVTPEISTKVRRDSLWPLWPCLLLLQIDEIHHLPVFQFLMRFLCDDPNFVEFDLIMIIFDMIACHSNYTIEKIGRVFFCVFSTSSFVKAATKSRPGFSPGVSARCCCT